MDPWKRRFLLETTISRFHVNFLGCTLKFFFLPLLWQTTSAVGLKFSTWHSATASQPPQQSCGQPCTRFRVWSWVGKFSESLAGVPSSKCKWCRIFAVLTSKLPKSKQNVNHRRCESQLLQGIGQIHFQVACDLGVASLYLCDHFCWLVDQSIIPLNDPLVQKQECSCELWSCLYRDHYITVREIPQNSPIQLQLLWYPPNG